MLNHDHPSKVTLEELLQVKRAERPSPEFWTKFESELRAKQLAALLQRRPWWHGPSIFLRRAYLPLGATAIVALAVLAVRSHQSSPSRAGQPVAASPVRRIVPVTVTTPRSAAVPAPARSVLEPSPVVETTVAALSEKLPDHASELTPWSAPRPEDTPSSRSIAASLARLEATEPDLANTALGGPLPVDASRLQANAMPAVADLASLTAVTPKRARLMAQLDDRRFTPEPQAPEMVRERLARRLADTDFNDSFSRVGLERGGVSVKF